MQYFVSDNASPASPLILKALLDCNVGDEAAYGFDQWSTRLDRRYSEFFETEVSVFVVPTGTAANALAISSISESFGEVLCHPSAHILLSEGGAVEFFSGGCRLQSIDGNDALISAVSLRDYIESPARRGLHQRALSVLSISQPTELGTLYSLDLLDELCAMARHRNMNVHMDGARLSNALAALKVSPADCTWRRGIKVLSLGTTKNGTLNAEAVISFDQETSRRLTYLQKRAGFLTSKMRYQAIQLLMFLESSFWLDCAEKANTFARQLGEAFSAHVDVKVRQPVQTNQLFIELSDRMVKQLRGCDIEFRKWKTGDYRLVTSYCDEQSVEIVERALLARSAIIAPAGPN